jgi:hypothetical protein
MSVRKLKPRTHNRQAAAALIAHHLTPFMSPCIFVASRLLLSDWLLQIPSITGLAPLALHFAVNLCGTAATQRRNQRRRLQIHAYNCDGAHLP